MVRQGRGCGRALFYGGALPTGEDLRIPQQSYIAPALQSSFVELQLYDAS
jgi:hypothetical protein